MSKFTPTEVKKWWDEFRLSHKILISYTRGKPCHQFIKYKSEELPGADLYERRFCKGPARGVVIAWRPNGSTGEPHTGWSHCKTHEVDRWTGDKKPLDAFDKIIAIRKAVTRGLKEERGDTAAYEVPHDIRKIFGSASWHERKRKFFRL